MIYLFLILHPQAGSRADNISNFLGSFLNKFTLCHQAEIHYYYTVVIFAISDVRSHAGSDCLTQKPLVEWSVDFFLTFSILGFS